MKFLENRATRSHNRFSPSARSLIIPIGFANVPLNPKAQESVE
jgi:hypothetical protein